MAIWPVCGRSLQLHSRQVVQLIRSATTVAVIIHQQPDGDAIGSAVALLHALPNRSVRIVGPSRWSANFAAITGPVKLADQLPAQTDLVIILDCAELGRTGLRSELQHFAAAGGQIVVIDHHQPSNLVELCDAYWYDPEACATAELISRLLTNLRLPITPTIAQLLLLGIYSDTGGFTHPNTSSQALRLAGQLVRQGADINKLSASLAGKVSLAKTRLWGEVSSQVRVTQYGLAIATITQDHFQRAKAELADAAGIAKFLLRLDTVKVGLVMIETTDGWRCSLRTQSNYVDLTRLARYFGGRGQRKAAGFLATNGLILGKIVPADTRN